MSHVSEGCDRCGQRQVDAHHEQGCAADEAAQVAVVTIADQHDVHRFRAVDLYAHLRSPQHGGASTGDDPYVVCVYCDQMQDSLTGRVIREGRVR